MTERVEPIDLGVVWAPNVPEALLVSGDDGVTRLFLRPRRDDPDSRDVVLEWRFPGVSTIGWPNDEAAPGHRLWDRGLREVLWAGEVIDSELVQETERRNRISFPDTTAGVGRHWIVRTKECTVEVVADALAVRRGERPALGPGS